MVFCFGFELLILFEILVFFMILSYNSIIFMYKVNIYAKIKEKL